MSILRVLVGLALFASSGLSQDGGQFVEMSDGIWAWFPNDPAAPNGALVVGTRSALAICPVASPRSARAFLQAADDLVVPSIDHVVLLDGRHFGVAGLPQRGFSLIAHELARRQIAETPPKLRPRGLQLQLPDRTVRNALRIDLGQVSVLLRPLGDHRCPGELVGEVWLSDALDQEPADAHAGHDHEPVDAAASEALAILCGESFVRRDLPDIDENADLPGWIRALHGLASRDVPLVLPGRGTPGDVEDLLQAAGLLRRAHEEGRQRLDAGHQGLDIAALEADHEDFGGDFERFSRQVVATLERRGHGAARVLFQREEGPAPTPRDDGHRVPLDHGGVTLQLEPIARELRLEREGVTLARFFTPPIPRRPVLARDDTLALVPCYGSGEVVVYDLLNREPSDRISVGERPAAACLMPDGFTLAVAVQGQDAIHLINITQGRIVSRIQTGMPAAPISIATTTDGRFLLCGSGGHDSEVAVVDLALGEVVAHVPTVAPAVDIFPLEDAARFAVILEDHSKSFILAYYGAERQAPQPARPTDLTVLGTIHGEHWTSKSYGLDVLRDEIRALRPEVVLVELPPDRWDRIWRDWTERGALVDDRVKVFPEYTEVLLPLAVTQGFKIEACAAWTTQMARYRRSQLAVLDTDLRWSSLNQKYRAAQSKLEPPTAREPADLPTWIHSEAYDERTRARLAPYDTFLNEHLGPGGWTTINDAHLALIEAALDRHHGRRVLLIFGASHKHRFIDRLRQRPNLVLRQAFTRTNRSDQR